MKNKKKLITIIVLSILLVLIVGISYAYFTTKVEGNEEAKNINVEAGKMNVKLTGPERITAEYLIPGESRSITFTVENIGNVPAIYNLDMIEVINEFDPTSDLVYTIESDNNGGRVQDKEAPTKDETLIRNILIQPGKENIQTYTLTILFKETDINQNSNQNKTFEGRVQINYLEDKTISANIIRNNLLQAEELDFIKGSPKSDGTENGTGLFYAPDDDGISYYFRGKKDKINNNVIFARKKWQIVRINGDGSIRIIYNDEDGPKNSAFNTDSLDRKYVGYTYDNNHDCTQEEPCYSDYQDGEFKEYYIDLNTNTKTDIIATDSTIKGVLESWYSDKLATYDNQIALTTFCNDSSIVIDNHGSSYDTVIFSPSKRFTDLKQPILTCPNPIELNSDVTHNYGGVYKLKIGLITLDEMSMGGVPWTSGNASTGNYLMRNFPYWSISPNYFVIWVYESFFNEAGFLNVDRTHAPSPAVVPVINLKSDVIFTGTGTEGDPYVVK